MLKINPLSTLYVGIDVSSKSNYVCALDFCEKHIEIFSKIILTYHQIAPFLIIYVLNCVLNRFFNLRYIRSG